MSAGLFACSLASTQNKYSVRFPSKNASLPLLGKVKFKDYVKDYRKVTAIVALRMYLYLGSWFTIACYRQFRRLTMCNIESERQCSAESMNSYYVVFDPNQAAEANCEGTQKKRRLYIAGELSTLHNIVTQVPGLLGPKFAVVLTALCLAKEEMLSYWRYHT